MVNIPHKIIELNIPGFEKSLEQGAIKHYSFDDTTSIDWYNSFIDKCMNSIGNNYLPVFRASDGEFYFATGWKNPSPPKNHNYIYHHIRYNLGKYKMGRFPWVVKTGAHDYSERYSFLKLYKARKIFCDQLSIISKNGILALDYSVRTPPFAEQYRIPFCNYLTEKNIILTKNNYFPFYFVYGLLNGPMKEEFYNERTILVVTSITLTKKKRIESFLLKKGAKEILFLDISPNQSMFHKLTIPNFKAKPEIILVGAGIGSANILTSLKSTNTLCLDAGHCLELMVHPEYARNRIFCMPDYENPNFRK